MKNEKLNLSFKLNLRTKTILIILLTIPQSNQEDFPKKSVKNLDLIKFLTSTAH